MARLLDKRLVFVTGKGGAGKTTVAAAVGLAAARRGKRTIVCEVAQQERMSRAFRREGVGFEEAELSPGLSAISIDPERALEEYLRIQVGSRRLADLLFSNRFFHYFAAAAPGMKELVTIGKIWELAQLERPWGGPRTLYDLVVVDAPATGHGLGILRTPRTFRDIARVGPIRRQADRIDSFIRDPDRTGVVVAALPEEMPVNETLDFRGALGEEMGLALDVVVVNALYPERFTGVEAERLARADGDLGQAARAALRAAASERNRARAQRVQLRRLKREVGDVATLPFLFEPELGLEEFDRLSRLLERRL
jgi:anion-transporting  ArsA/GET3 family ATPase